METLSNRVCFRDGRRESEDLGEIFIMRAYFRGQSGKVLDGEKKRLGQREDCSRSSVAQVLSWLSF